MAFGYIPPMDLLRVDIGIGIHYATSLPPGSHILRAHCLDLSRIYIVANIIMFIWWVRELFARANKTNVRDLLGRGAKLMVRECAHYDVKVTVWWTQPTTIRRRRRRRRGVNYNNNHKIKLRSRFYATNLGVSFRGISNTSLPSGKRGIWWTSANPSNAC